MIPRLQIISTAFFFLCWGIILEAQPLHYGYTQGPLLKYSARVDLFFTTEAMLMSPQITFERIVFQNRMDYVAAWVGLGPYLHGGDSHRLGLSNRLGLAYRTHKHNLEHLEIGGEVLYYVNVSNDTKITPIFLLGYVREDVYKPNFNYRINLTISPWNRDKERILSSLLGLQLGVCRRF
jgi:hypothetical protein